MTECELNSLKTKVDAMSIEEQKIVISCLPVDLMLAGISERYNDMSSKVDTLRNFLG